MRNNTHTPFLVRCLALVFTFMLVSSGILAQTAQQQIVAVGNTIGVQMTPSSNMTGTFTGYNVTLRYLKSYNITLTNLTQGAGFSGITSQGRITDPGDALYWIEDFAGTNINLVSQTYNSSTDYTMFTVQTSGGSGSGTFSIVHGGVYSGSYVEISGADRTNNSSPFYGPGATSGSQSTSGVPLPVELLNFDAHRQDNQSVLLVWATASEFDNNFFEIERSSDGQQWQVIGKVQGKGNSAAVTHYKWADLDILNQSWPMVYYRLSQTDLNGEKEYLGVRKLGNTRQSSFNDISLTHIDIYPNPASDFINLDAQNLPEGASLFLINQFGVELKKFNFGNSMRLSLEPFEPGVYFLRIVEPKSGFNQQLKFIIAR